MSKPYLLKLILMATAVCGCSSIAMAQFGAGHNQLGSSPTVSPYINLLRGGNAGLNYYGLVRPQQDFALQNQQLGQGIQSLQMQHGSQMPMNTGSYGYSQLGMTGHPVIFNSFGNGQFSGGYTGIGGGFSGGGGGFGGGFTGGGGLVGGGIGGGSVNGGFNGSVGGGGYNGAGDFGGAQFGSQSGFGGIGTTGGGLGNVSSGFGGVSGHPSQFGGIGNSYRAGR